MCGWIYLFTPHFRCCYKQKSETFFSLSPIRLLCTCWAFYCHLFYTLHCIWFYCVFHTHNTQQSCEVLCRQTTTDTFAYFVSFLFTHELLHSVNKPHIVSKCHLVCALFENIWNQIGQSNIQTLSVILSLFCYSQNGSMQNDTVHGPKIHCVSSIMCVFGWCQCFQWNFH